MAGKVEYHKIVNFTTNGDLGISANVITEIAKQAVNEVEGASIASSHSLISKHPVSCKFTKRGDLIINVTIKVNYGYSINDTCARVQERIEHNLMYMTEIRPRKVHVSVDDVK